MIQYHTLNEILPLILITCNNENVEQVIFWNLPGFEFDQNLNWNNFIDNKLTHYYSIHLALKK